jgi:hypothetical protein
MVKRLAVLGSMILVGLASSGLADPPTTLIGSWRVVGCQTSPKDPANCAKGTIVFEAKRWSVELPCCKRSSDYKLMSTTKDRFSITSGGDQSEIRIDADGAAHWRPGGLGGRVGELMFVRTK